MPYAAFMMVLLAGPGLVIAKPARPPVDWDKLTEKEADLHSLIVGFKAAEKGADAKAVGRKRAASHSKAGTQLKKAFTAIPAQSVRLPGGKSLKQVAAIYEADPDVAYVEPNYKLYPSLVPNDPQYGSLWGMPRIRAPQAWDITTGSASVVVAVIDTGLDRTHPDLINNLYENPGEIGLDGSLNDKRTNGLDDDGNGYVDDWRGWDFFDNDNDPSDSHGHGTHCAGTIGAVGNNGIGVVGVNWTVKLVGLRFLGPSGGYTDDAVEAVLYAANLIPGVRLSNNSWGGGGYSQALKDAIDVAGAAGQLFMAAAGNYSSDNDAVAFFPSSYICENLIAVASITSGGALSDFSNYGANSVDIAAPGSDILSTKPGGGYQTMSGTSMATPHVTGAAALLWSLDTSLSWKSIRDAILDGARYNVNLVGKVVTDGELDIEKALAKLNPPVLSDTRYYVLEGATTNIGVTLFKQPLADMTVTVARVSGSTNLYVDGDPQLVFTPANWSTPQTFTVGALNDADMTNDMAFFQVTADRGGSTSFQLQQMDLGDTVPPQCLISGALSADGARIVVDFLFDEDVIGFEAGDVVYTSNIAGGATLVSLTDISGTGRRFAAVFDIGGRFGSLSITIPAGSLTDMSGNVNANAEYRYTYTVPFVRTDFSENFDGYATVWTPSVLEYEDYTTAGWRWGVPVFGTAWTGPVAAASGGKCLGVMDGPYAKRLDSWIDSPPFRVGTEPVLRFKVWMEGDTYGHGSVQVHNGYGWYDMTPGGSYVTTTNVWLSQEIALDNATFGNRVLQVRFRSLNYYAGGLAAMYVDDVSVHSQQPPGIYLTAIDPDNGTAGTSVTVALTIYNSSGSGYSNVSGIVACSDTGVTITNGTPVSYGNLAAGSLVTSAAPVMVELAAPGSFDTDRIMVDQQIKSGSAHLFSDSAWFTVLGAGVVATNGLTVRNTAGVTNWVGDFLPGDGNPGSCLLQVVYAGANGVADPPQADGGVTGDDRLLAGGVDGRTTGRFGEGGVVRDAGLFSRLAVHGLASNSMIYVRAWDGSSFARSAVYGDSAVKPVRLSAGEVVEFGGWGVSRVLGIPAASLADLVDRDGDSIPDAWCALFGVDPDRPILPLPASVSMEAAVTGLNRPGRVAVSSNMVFIADSDNHRIEVWNRSLTTRLARMGGSQGTGTNSFNRPQGLSVSPDGTRLMVADTLNYRVMLFAVDPVNGTLTHLWSAGAIGTASNLTFRAPFAVSLMAGESFFVADSHPTDFYANHNVHIYPTSSGPVTLIGSTAGTAGGQFTRPLGVDAGPSGEVFVADTGNHRIQGFLPDGTFSWVFGSYGTNTAEFKEPRDVSLGIGGRLYVAETGGSRIQVLDASAAPDVSSIALLGSNGSEPGQFRAPQGVAPVMDDGIIYVADTFNNRVQKLRVILDGDKDGMEDVWEELHGLDCHNAADAFEDPDGDELLNIGEYRLRTDPRLRDTNGNGTSDGWDVAHGLDPAAVGGAVSSLSIGGFSGLSKSLSWQAVLDGIYQIQSSTNLLQTNLWTDVGAVTSLVNGTLNWVVVPAPTNQVEFYRILWINAP